MGRSKALFFLIIFLAALIRLSFLKDFPNGFSGDEASQGYTAYSIFKTGRDEWGEFLPLNPRSFGDFKPPLYTYLTVPSVGLFGLSEGAVRLPSAIIGILTVIVIYFLTKKILGFSDFFSAQGKKAISMLSAFLLAVSPWHIQFSRTAFEGNLGVFLFSAGFLFVLKGIKTPRFYPLAAFFWGLSLYSYHSAKFFTISFMVFMGIVLWKRIKNKQIPRPRFLKTFFTATIIFAIFLIPVATSFIQGQGSSRFLDVGIFGGGYPNQIAVAQADHGGGALFRLIHNKFRFYLTTFTDNYFSYFSWQFFFSGNRPDFSYLNLSGFPLLYLFEVPLILSFIVLTIKKPAFWQALLWGWVILAPVPAALTGGSMHANRAVMFLPALQIMGAVGGYGLFMEIKKISSGRLLKTIKTGLFVIIFISVASFFDYYFIHLPRHNSESLRVGYREMVKYLLTVEEKYETIVVSLKLTEPQSFVAFYGKKDPRLFQRESIQWLKYEKEGKKYLDQLDNYHLGKYWFKRMNYQDEKHFQKTIFAGKTEEFPENATPLFTFNDFEGKPVYKILENDKNERQK